MPIKKALTTQALVLVPKKGCCSVLGRKDGEDEKIRGEEEVSRCRFSKWDCHAVTTV
ncbi:MAG: hypothetical protein M1835_001196, partial [Candelina submexicana]